MTVALFIGGWLLGWLLAATVTGRLWYVAVAFIPYGVLCALFARAVIQTRRERRWPE